AALPSKKKLADAVRARLETAIPKPECELRYSNPWQLLIATILSAQSTDRMVNRVTPTLFERFPSPKALAQSASVEVESLIKPTGFYRNKARSIRGASKILVEQFAGHVPQSIDDLVTLPGVARKTANVVLGTAFRLPSGMAVDTHAKRVSLRLSLTKHSDQDK